MIREAETARLHRLHQLGILDTEDDRLFRDLAEQALTLLPGTTIAGVTLIDTDRQWFKTVIGSHVKEIPRSISFCSHTIEEPESLVIEDMTLDSRFSSNPLVTSAPALRFYAGIKLLGGVGALCVISLKPRRVTESELTKLTKLARYVEIQLLAHGTLFNLPN